MSQLMGSHAFGEVARKLDPFVRTRDGVPYFALMFASVGEAERSDARSRLVVDEKTREYEKIPTMLVTCLVTC